MIEPSIASQEDRNRAVDAVNAIVSDGFAVGCCLMSENDGHEFAAYLADDFARHRTTAEAASAARVAELRNAALDALAGWRYIRQHHGDLYGVGWDRVENALTAALANLRGGAQ